MLAGLAAGLLGGAWLSAPAGAASVNCVAGLAEVTQPGQSVCFGSDPTAGLPQVAADEQPTGDTTLIFSDDPEYVPAPGILYRDTVTVRSGQAPQPFRVYLYHVDPAAASGPLYVGVVVTNNGSAPAVVTLTNWAVGGPSRQYLLVGKDATSGFLASAPTPVALTLAPGTSALLDAALPAADQIDGRAIQPGQALNAIFGGTTTAPVQVTVAAAGAPIQSPDFVNGLQVLPPQRQSPGQEPMRGTFLQADEAGTYTLQAAGDGQIVLHVADAGRYLTGYDAVDAHAVVDYGNYGVVYHDSLAIVAPASGGSTHAAVVLIPRGGNFTTAVDATAGLLSASAPPGSPLPSDNQFLPPLTFGSVVNMYCLHAGQTTPASLTWMPAAGSFLPLDLWVAPLSGGLTGMAGSATCAPTVAGVAPASASPGTTVTLTGQGFGGQPGTVVLTRAGAPAVSLSPAGADWSHTSASVQVPAGLTPGPVDLAVYNAATGLSSAPQSFLVLPPPPPPSLQAVVPAPLEPGGQVELSGSGFGAGGTVSFQQGNAAPVTTDATSWSSGEVRAVVPATLTPGSATVSVTDAATGQQSNALAVQIAAGPAIAAPAPLSAQVGAPFAFALQAVSGTPYYTWAIASGGLPLGLALDPGSGRITGLPTETGTFTATVRLTDGLGATGETALRITVSPEPPPVTSPGPAVPTPIAKGLPAPFPGESAAASSSVPAGTSATPASTAPASSGRKSPPASGGSGSVKTIRPVGAVSVSVAASRLAALLAASRSSGGSIAVRVASRLPARARVTLPLRALGPWVARGKGLTLEFGPASLALPSADLAAARAAGARSGAAAGRADLTLDVTVTPASAAALRPAALDAVAPAGARVQLASPVFSIAVSAGAQGHQRAPRFTRPVVARLALTPAFAAQAPFLACARLGPSGRPSSEPSAVAPAGAAAVACAVPGAGRYAVLATRVSFADVSGWAARAVAVAAAHHVVTGVTRGEFAPTGTVTRAEFAAMLARALGLPADATAARRFADVPARAWYAGAVGAVAHAGLLQGISASLFDPLAPVTRQQAAVVLARALPWVGRPRTAAALRFADAGTIASWARAGVAAAAASGLMQGFPGGTFRPLAVLDRAQAAAVFVRYLSLGVPRVSG